MSFPRAITGREIATPSYRLCSSQVWCSAQAVDSNVLPVPALPKQVINEIPSSSSASMKNCCSRLRARIGYLPAPSRIPASAAAEPFLPHNNGPACFAFRRNQQHVFVERQGIRQFRFQTKLSFRGEPLEFVTAQRNASIRALIRVFRDFVIEVVLRLKPTARALSCTLTSFVTRIVGGGKDSCTKQRTGDDTVCPLGQVGKYARNRCIPGEA